MTDGSKVVLATSTSPFLDSFSTGEAAGPTPPQNGQSGSNEERPSLERAKPLSGPHGPPQPSLISKTSYPTAIEWLGQPLREDVPRARVLHYRHPVHHEYDLEDYARCLLRLLLEIRSKFSVRIPQKFDSKLTVSQLPKFLLRRTMRPTLFICHSVGGLVLKKVKSSVPPSPTLLTN